MSWYGTLVLAKPGKGSLSACEEVRRAFGSRFVTPSVMRVFGNKLGLYDLGDGWQRVGVRLVNRQRLRLAGGVQDVAAGTGAPALAAWVFESTCVHLEARTPAGVAVSVHLPNSDESCGYQHPEGRPGRVEPRRAVEALEAWAHEAGRTPAPDIISAVLDGTWDGSPFVEDCVLALFAALGFPSGREVLPVVDPDDPAFGDYALWSHFANNSAGNLVRAAEMGWVLGPEFDVTPMEQDYLRFEELVWSSVYGGGLSRDELIAEYHKLASRWPDPKASRQRRD
ncbi:hypothetical protein AB0H83_27830 [Dactylosporangium sp. NPDC050688]|uniref:alpha-L-rhamnosidase C-terminal domain-containing protein n=1 Tax=Dactylosporangium sp. NPDC050688 TaxID=3157217 RepID=UPI003411104C